MKILFTYLLFCICTIPLFPQEGWFSINHIANGNDMKSIYFINDSVGFTVSNEGNLFRTTNKGINWAHTKLSSSSLNDIFYKDNVGFIVGDSGKIFKSTDGINWIEKNSGTTNKLNAVYFFDPDTGYVFGYASTILKTKNSGETWEKLNINSGLTITDGAFPTPDFGMCTSLEGVLLRTTDYGQNWQYLGYSFTDEFYSITFIDTNTAYICGFETDVPFVLKTTDRGNEFQHIYRVSRFASTCFTDTTTGYMVGEGGYIGKTTDGGDSWNQQKSYSYKDLNSIYFLDEDNGYACGKDSTILQTSDGGLNWSLLGSSHTLQLKGVNFSNEQTGYALSYDGDLLKTSDGGSKWELFNKKIPGNYPLGFECIYFINSDTGFIGAHGLLLRTTNGGETWETNNFTNQNIYSFSIIKFYDNNIGVIKAKDKLLKTTDAGRNWIIYDFIQDYSDINFLDNNTLITVGERNIIHKSTDGGNTWQAKNSNTYQFLYSVFFINDKIGYAVGSKGTIMRTDDSGETWAQVISNTTQYLLEIKFLQNGNGYIIGDHGSILYSKDAGLSWSFQNSNTYANLNSIYFTSTTTGYIVGDGGTMLKTVNSGITSVERENIITPVEFSLSQNYPNPFNPTTTIEYSLPKYSFVSIKIYNSLGQEIKELVNKEQSPGRHKVYFNGSNLSSGIYYYRITADDFSEVKKMILLK